MAMTHPLPRPSSRFDRERGVFIVPGMDELGQWSGFYEVAKPLDVMRELGGEQQVPGGSGVGGH